MVQISIVIPIKNEAQNIGGLVETIQRVCGELAPFEVLVVDDGSTDASADIVVDLIRSSKFLRLLRHEKSAGQSAAVHSGVLAARGVIIATLDGDGQNPPEDLPKILLPLLAADAPPNLGLVAGQRVGRRDTLSKRLASKFANGLRAKLLKDGTRDTGCGLKAFRRDAYLQLPYFDHMHRYLPALFTRASWDVAHVDVSHRARQAGSSNYSNLQRALVGAVDLIGVMWLLRRKKKTSYVEKLSSMDKT